MEAKAQKAAGLYRHSWRCDLQSCFPSSWSAVVCGALAGRVQPFQPSPVFPALRPARAAKAATRSVFFDGNSQVWFDKDIAPERLGKSTRARDAAGIDCLNKQC
jgi:hypothetical protein